MEKEDLIEIVNSELKPIGFNRKGLRWRCETNELIKEVDLQRSRFSKLYYLNFGFTIKGLPLAHFTQHVPLRFGSIITLENSFINRFLDLEEFWTRDVDYFKELMNRELTTPMKQIDSIAGLEMFVHSLVERGWPLLLPVETKKLFNLEHL